MIGTIFIKDLLLRCTIGIDKEEKVIKTDVIINITLWVNMEKTLKTDSVKDSVNYATVYNKILLLENEEFNLQETLVKRIIDICLEDKKVLKVKVSAEKPYVMKHVRSIGVELEAEQE